MFAKIKIIGHIKKVTINNIYLYMELVKKRICIKFLGIKLISNKIKATNHIIGLVCCIFVIFLKISNIKDETILKYEIIEIIHINKNIASNLWKNLPNSIYLVSRYNGITCSVEGKKGNIIKRETTLKNRYIAEKVIDIMEIFFKSLVFSSFEGIK